jgi:Ca2+-binding RTX toxin-like protein
VANLAAGEVVRSPFPWLGGATVDDLVSVENLRGTAHGDHITGDAGANSLSGEGGDDTVDGAGGHDTLSGGTGEDSLVGGSGNDRIDPGAGDDTLDGGSGTDLLFLSTSADVSVAFWSGLVTGDRGRKEIASFENVTTGSGDDRFDGDIWGIDSVVNTGSGKDSLYGGGGDETLNAGNDDDIADGGSGDDSMSGGSGHDVMSDVWGFGADTELGASGDDTLGGGSGTDSLSGGTGDDVIRGGEGEDIISTGTGADVLRWQGPSLWTAGDATGMDLVLDFDPAEDRFSFGDGFFATEPVGATALSDVLFAFPDFAGGSFLVADTDEAGWVTIAQFQGVAAAALNAMIQDESILSVALGPVGEGAPGGFGLLG